ncbi:hypothetical protein L1887_10998 [Cichorium endivia]|nr:hypothetical protein L1887_10998 [Cichorium endivia]
MENELHSGVTFCALDFLSNPEISNLCVCFYLCPYLRVPDSIFVEALPAGIIFLVHSNDHDRDRVVDARDELHMILIENISIIGPILKMKVSRSNGGNPSTPLLRHDTEIPGVD